MTHKILQKRHPESASTAYHLAEILRLRGKSAAALPYFAASLEYFREIAALSSPVAIRRLGRCALIPFFSFFLHCTYALCIMATYVVLMFFMAVVVYIPLLCASSDPDAHNLISPLHMRM